MGKPYFCKRFNMAQISFAEHCKRIAHLYAKNKHLKQGLILSNIVWAICVVALLITR
jgi:hypothetical protein